MAYGWRFFTDPEKQWHWERISVVHGTVQSRQAYDSYDECVKAAGQYGYVYLPSQEKKRAGSAARV